MIAAQGSGTIAFMKRHLYILTGASRGMGLAMAEQLLQPQHYLLCLSRQRNESLTLRAQQSGAVIAQWQQDLGETAASATRLASWLAQQHSADWASASLINNAGVIANPVPLSAAEASDVGTALRVGLEAPLLLTSAFLRCTETWPVPRRVLNISSGLGRRAMASQAPYCAAKAGMDHFTRCLALEEAAKPNGAKVCSIAPGVIDTDMQTQLRSGDDATFPDRKGFVAMKVGGQLASPADAAARLLAYLAHPNFGTLAVADVRDV